LISVWAKKKAFRDESESITVIEANDKLTLMNSPNKTKKQDQAY
jgi:hypothetical protein